MNPKKKGNAGENAFANWLVDNGIKAWKDGASGGGNNEKGDIGNNLNLHIEVKTVKKINLLEVWKKARHECEKTHNDPVLAIRFDGMPERKWLMVLDSDHFLDLLTKEEGVKTDYQDPKMKWALTGLKNAINSVLKFLP
jgi:Holliday junction resolvase